MACHRRYPPFNEAGFTLIEILVVISILSAVMASGLWVSFDAYQSAEDGYKIEETASSLLMARSNSISRSLAQSTSSTLSFFPAESAIPDQSISFSSAGNPNMPLSLKPKNTNLLSLMVYENGEITEQR
jgi:prepilin-type N-terminal cleavage/methylation domain-containing protein